MWDSASLDRLKDAVSTYDGKSVRRLCDELIDFISSSESLFPVKPAKEILNLLRRKRFFEPLKLVADALMQSGQQAGIVRRQYAQGLIEEKDFIAAIAVLEDLSKDCADDAVELAEARGLIGRAKKQQYVNTPKKTPAQRKLLGEAIAAYHQVYLSEPSTYLWHGINTVALVKRALRDGVTPDPAIDADAIASALLVTIGAKAPGELFAWDIATAAEACLALGKIDEALDWLKKYVVAEYTDAFEVGSTLRQLREVWGLTDSGPGGDLVAVLQAALLMREGGAISLSGRDVKTAVEHTGARKEAFEKVFGKEGPFTYEWYIKGATRARSVGRVGDARGQGIGTGFLIRAQDFLTWGKKDEVLFITNAHVMGRTETGALAPEEVEVRFEAFDPKRSFKVSALIWESPTSKLDATVVRLQGLPPELVALPLGPAEEPEFVEGVERRFYIIGHPHGGALSISLSDNTQVGWGKPLLHYRTPTQPGSSGSPVLDDKWQVVALHHAGDGQMQRLDGHPGVYQANEGIWIHEIIGKTKEIAPPPAGGEVESAGPRNPPTSAPATPSSRQGIFISYSHKDKKLLGELQTYLKPLVKIDGLQKWDDNDIRPGEDWLQAIRTAMATCRVAVLLVSQDYLASDFIGVEEFPQIIKDARSAGVTVFWIPLAASTYEKTELAALQAAIDPKKPINKMGKAERQEAWLQIVKKLERSGA
ncbi:MAG TPA: trypsin-like peptidase domain-containing protein [Polyangia bacterium]|nr:trypsin-like peptidase domain-containing protein [Polyangia bacterium]